MGKGQAFLSDLEDTPGGKIRHLNVIISEPDDDMHYLVVPITTWREKDGRPLPGQDNSCVLSAGCHPFIKHESYVFYAKARKMSYVAVFNGIKKGILIKKEDMPADIVRRMREGASNSPYLPDEFKYFLSFF
jgi:hypothetical protein